MSNARLTPLDHVPDVVARRRLRIDGQADHVLPVADPAVEIPVGPAVGIDREVTVDVVRARIPVSLHGTIEEEVEHRAARRAARTGQPQFRIEGEACVNGTGIGTLAGRCRCRATSSEPPLRAPRTEGTTSRTTE